VERGDLVRIERWARLSFAVGVLSVVAVLASHLALADIYHGEGDLTLEWNALRLCFGIIVVFQLSALATLREIIRRGRDLPKRAVLALTLVRDPRFGSSRCASTVNEVRSRRSARRASGAGV